MIGKETLLIAEMVQNEKDVSEDDVFSALEAAIGAANRKAASDDIDVRVAIDRQSGDYCVYRRWHVIDDEDPEFASPDYQILFSTARTKDETIEVGDYIEEEIEAVPFGRISAHTAKQVIMQKLREAERVRISATYTPQIDKVLMGVIKRQENSGVYVELSEGVEGFIPREEMIPNEILRPGQRVRAHLIEVRSEMRGPQLILSRISPEFLISMFKIEVLEVGQGLIDIMAAARDPGARAKVAVRSNDPRLDPVGACVGMRGARVQSISNEVAEEKIDIILWDEDLPKYVINAMSPARVTSIVVDEAKRHIDIAVDEDKLSLAIGRGGQNVKLASQLLGWNLNIISTEDAALKNQQEANALVTMFHEDLDVDEEVATILVQEGFSSIEEIVYVKPEELLKIEEFDEKIVEEIRSRARDVMLTRAVSADSENGSKDDLSTIDGIDQLTIQKLNACDISTVENLADQSIDDLLEIPGMDKRLAGDLIMSARAIVFDDDEESDKNDASSEHGSETSTE